MYLVFFGIFWYKMNSVIAFLYFNGRVYEENDGEKVRLANNEIISYISCRFLVSGKYIALQICDDEDVETMIKQQQGKMSVLELYIEKDVAGGYVFHSANSFRSCENNLSNNETEPSRNVSNLHEDEDEDDDDDYLMSNSYVEDSLDEDDSVDGISDTDDEVVDMVQPVTIMEFKIHFEMMLSIITISIGVILMRRTFVVWRCHILSMLGKNYMLVWILIVKMLKKNALKQYVMKVHQSFKVLETKSHKYIVCCPNKSAECPCPFYMRAILSKKTDSWKVTQWAGPHTCLNMSMTQDHEKLDSDFIATCVVGMIREDPSIKVSLIQERINNAFSYKVSYKKAWMAKQKAIAIEYSDWEESYAKLSSVFWTFGQCKEAFNYCKPIIQVDGIHLYEKYRGILLMATLQDGNGGVLPLAFVIVEGEMLTAWSWFLAHLREHVTNKNGICLISDRHASIKSVVANEHLGWQPPYAYHLSPTICTWIDCISKKKWSMTYDKEGRRYGHMTTNLSKCVNKVLKDCYNLPITTLVKTTYSRCRKYFVDRGCQAQRQLNEGQIYCSKVVKELQKNQEEAFSHIVRVYDIHSTRFEVEETFNPRTQRGGQKWAVNLNDHYCQCRKYSALHYPCSHIIAICGYVSINYFQYIDVVYTNEHILKAYSAQWWPLGNGAVIPPSDEPWTLIPDPTTIRAKGRSKSTRIRNEMDWLEPSEH
ncbi:hypothetical protein HKD37_18G050042 [Glycine soja]